MRAIATIAFVIEHQQGHLNPTFGLARRLAARGHRVAYLGLADGAAAVSDQGFDFVPIFERQFPRGAAGAAGAPGAAGVGGAGSGGSAAAGAAAVATAAADAAASSPHAVTWRILLDGDAELDAAVAALRPDLFVLTSFYAPHALLLRRRYGVPAVLLTTILRTFAKTDLARGVSGLLAGDRAARERFYSVLAAGTAGQAPLDAAGAARRLLAQVLRLRELILCPADLELPELRRSAEPEVHYVEPCVDGERRNRGSFPWDGLEAGRRLLYVSLGSQSHRAGRERVKDFLDAVGAAFAERGDWQVVISTGGLVAPAEVACPRGGLVVAWAPQTALLERASVALIQGGLGAVKECILAGVPMVVFPIDNDQPDNARRVVHHGLGARGDLRRAGPAAVADLVALADRPAVRYNLAEMRRRFHAAEAHGVGVRLVEQLACRG